MGQAEADAAARVIMSKSLFRISSKYLEAENFERELEAKINVKHAICVNSGTSALQCCLAALNIGPGDEVIVPAYTYMATANAVLAVGAIPVLAEINETQTIDVADVEKKISKYTKAVIPVHLNGHPADLDALKALCDPRGIKIIEDACQADGGSYKGKRLGTIGAAGAFSFNYFKIISAGEGGAVLTNDDTYYERALIYHDTGTAYRPYAEAMTEPFFSSYNMRTNEIAAAVLREQLKRLDGILEDLRRVRKEITAGIKLNDGVHFTPFNDAEGDCGTLLGLIFDDADRAAAFATEVGGLCLINSKKHIYINWDPMLNRLGGHTDAMNPYLDPANADLNKEINPDTCPVTLDILRRSVNISMNPDWTAEEIAEKIAKINAALGA